MNCLSARDVVATHLARYPKAQPVDLLKMLFQGEFGPGHLIADKKGNREFLENEYAQMAASQGEWAEDIGFGFCRLHLRAISGGLSVDTFQRLFELSAACEYGTAEGFAAKAEALREFAIPIDGIDLGKPPRHSADFHKFYPGQCNYRVVKAEFCRFLALFAKIDALLPQSNLIVGIDGDSAAGKSTLAEMLQQVYDCNVLHMDHFFLRPNQRTENRLAEPGGNVDYERFYEEALRHVVAGDGFKYHPFDCRVWDFGDEIAITPNRLTVVEGSYAHHPTLLDAYGIRVFMEIDGDEQMRRILQRNGAEMAAKFRDIWIPMEKKYHAAFDVKTKSDMVF